MHGLDRERWWKARWSVRPCRWAEALGAGRTLLKHYASTELVEKLISLGHLARVGKTLEECISYSRDRGQLMAYYHDYPVESAKMVDARKSLCLASEKECLDSGLFDERPASEDFRG